MFSALCNTRVTIANYADRKAYYKSRFSKSWRQRLGVTIKRLRLSQMRPLKINLRGGAFCAADSRARAARRSERGLRYKEKFIFDRQRALS
jgi:hypothetical protein